MISGRDRPGLHISRRRLRMPRVRETNRLDRETFGHRRVGTVSTDSLSGKICRHRLDNHLSGNGLAIALRPIV
jgi:hypothetical protein